MEKIVIANLKMNLINTEIIDYLNEVNKSINTKKVVICPTSIYLPYFLNNNYSVGIQNIAETEEGAYTGEVSATQVASIGVNYAIIGHSERRALFSESDISINKKLLIGLRNKLTMVLCIGETKEEKDMHKTNQVLKRQLINTFKNVDIDQVKKVIVAYEPVWSIGTGNVPTNKEILAIVNYIKAVVNDIYKNDINIPVLYGGSVNENNITDLNDINELAGYLVGGASLKPDKLKKIKEVVIG